MKQILNAESIIQRDAIVSRLNSEGIETLSPPRDMSRKVADTTLDLSLVGYSVLFDGFAIYVRDEDQERAREITREFLADAEKRQRLELDRQPQDPWASFYWCSVFSLTLPVIMHLAALYHLNKALSSGQPVLNPGRATAASLLLFVTAALGPLFWIYLKG